MGRLAGFDDLMGGLRWVSRLAARGGNNGHSGPNHRKGVQ